MQPLLNKHSKGWPKESPSAKGRGPLNVVFPLALRRCLVFCAPMTKWPDHLFVYGTLLADAGHEMGALLRHHGTLLGKGSIQARLYIITETDAVGTNTYPGAVPSAFPSDRVFGDLVAVHDGEAVFPRFNDFEACAPGWPEPYEFLLRDIDVTLDTGAVIRASSYLYCWDTSRAELVPSGRFDRHAPDAR